MHGDDRPAPVTDGQHCPRGCPGPEARPASRRLVLSGFAGTAGLALVAACGGAGSTGGAAAGPGPGGTDSKSSGGAGSQGSVGGAPLARVTDIPVGGAVSAQDPAGNPLIVSRPSNGEVVAFSAICTHQGCTVAPQGDRLQCPCHGSTYDPATGENTGGPAPEPLAQVRVQVRDGAVVES